MSRTSNIKVATAIVGMFSVALGGGVVVVSSANADPPTNCVVDNQSDLDCDGTPDYYDQCVEDPGPSEFTDPSRPNGGCPDGRPFTPPAPQYPSPTPSPSPSQGPTDVPSPSPTPSPTPPVEPEPTFVINEFTATALTCRRGTSLVSYSLTEEAAMRVKYGKGRWQRLGEERVGKHSFRTRFMAKLPRRANVRVVRLQANPLDDTVAQDTDTVVFVLKRPSRRACR